MRQPLLLTSDEVQQQAIDAGLPSYAVAVIPGMLQPAGTLHTRHSAKSTTLYNSLEVDGAINYLLGSRFTQLTPLLTAPGVVRDGSEKGTYRWVGRELPASESVRQLYSKLNHFGVDTRWTGLVAASFTTSDPDLINFMEALDGNTE